MRAKERFYRSPEIQPELRSRLVRQYMCSDALRPCLTCSWLDGQCILYETKVFSRSILNCCSNVNKKENRKLFIE